MGPKKVSHFQICILCNDFYKSAVNARTEFFLIPLNSNQFLWKWIQLLSNWVFFPCSVILTNGPRHEGQQRRSFNLVCSGPAVPPFLKLTGDDFEVDVNRNWDHFGVDLRIISGWGSFRGLYRSPGSRESQRPLP